MPTALLVQTLFDPAQRRAAMPWRSTGRRSTRSRAGSNPWTSRSVGRDCAISVCREAVTHRSPGSAAVTPLHPGKIADYPQSHAESVPHRGAGLCNAFGVKGARTWTSRSATRIPVSDRPGYAGREGYFRRPQNISLTFSKTPRASITARLFSGAALAARYAAIILSYYPNLWPESIRALLIHSARWTDAMRREFPDNQRQNRLRSYGFGVPDLSRALWSMANSATLIVEHELQPFDKVDGELKTKDMHLHRLPWPTSLLQNLGETEIRMRVTLSYFIEPSLGVVVGPKNTAISPTDCGSK